MPAMGQKTMEEVIEQHTSQQKNQVGMVIVGVEPEGHADQKYLRRLIFAQVLQCIIACQYQRQKQKKEHIGIEQHEMTPTLKN